MYKERVAQYEHIEKELDDAIMNAAEGTAGDPPSDVLTTLGSAPTASKRRVQQSLALANRLQAKAKECERLMQENVNLQKKLRDYEDDAQMYKRLAGKANQPTSYLMQDIEKGERELNKAHKINRGYKDENTKLEDENKALKLQLKELKSDLSALSTKKKETDALQSTLMGIVREASTKQVSVDSMRKKLASAAPKGEMERTVKRMASKSRSPKRGNKKVVDNELPAWYGALKQNLS